MSRSGSFATEQERFWAGEFGDAYVDRNAGEELVSSNTALFSRILSRTRDVRSVLELGANVGLNLLAIRRLLADARLAAVEINEKAVDQLYQIGDIEVFPISLLDFEPDMARDLVFTKGVLIHMPPERLPDVYDLLRRASRRYILIVEYYNPTPVEVPYRSHRGVLFKRDFAGEMLDRYPDLELVDYGFVYHRDNQFRQDDSTWFLLETRA